MKLYNNIFASSYRCYNKFYEDARSRFRAALIVSVHLSGFIFLLSIIVNKKFAIDFSSKNNSNIFRIIYCVAIFFIYALVVKYYSKDRVENILFDFKKHTSEIRKVWGFITVISLILEYVGIAILLCK
jgi:Kef-type K+ transport system membrane component KefB